jgi:anti-sigma factor RsiW
MKPKSSHPELDVLELHILRRLPEPENESVEEHLLVCEACQAMTALMESQIKRIQEALSELLVPAN